MPLVMPRDEFRAISKCLCCYRPEDLDITDKFTKIRVIKETINARFQKAVRLGAFVSFDEATVSSRSNWLPAREYNPMKPHKFGLKLCMTCCRSLGSAIPWSFIKANIETPTNQSMKPMAIMRIRQSFVWMIPHRLLQPCSATAFG